MMEIVGRLDGAMSEKDAGAIRHLFSTAAVAEIKPLGLRIDFLDTIAEMFRRSLPALAGSFVGRETSQSWANQNGIVREWFYPVQLASGDKVRSRQLEIIEFTDDLGAIASYRLRMNLLLAKQFERALGEDFASLPGITRVPR